MHKVSVIIPNYNRSKVIKRTLDAVLNQTLKPFEVIVVDDGSTDNSLEVLQQYGSRITVITQENLGPAAARNNGFLNSSGDFISFMDSDDIPSLNKLEVQVNNLINQNADLVIGPWVRGWFNDTKFKAENVVLQMQGVPSSKSLLYWFLTEWSMVFQQTLIRKGSLLQVGLYDEQMKVMEDGDLFVRFLLANAKVVFEQESLLLYRLGNEDKLTHAGASDVRKLKDRLYFYKKLFGYSKALDIYNEASFQLQLFVLSEALKKIGIEDEVLNGYIKKSKFYFRMLSLKKRLTLGFQQRIQGHRWSRAYCTKELVVEQKQLINQLGYTLMP
ncbi:glycosyltransferase family 2 protein [Winogradskyella aurantia]|uniref:Glycosyltransferase 2-like domain-containing protein n=1 Tax=Winogradskyella aurantia TaxID=1915063 RepID=A0A265UV98_9FLAO|nr:glycosyltransferase family 2 protein [Winogradskyella aurantia]OZV69239.1 hypothetical protein CA834_07220 [Winogradskyella aurantia]